MRKRLTKLNERESWRNRGACSRYPDHKSLPSALCEGEVGTTGNAAAPKYDLDERTAKLGEVIIEFAKKLPQNPVTNRIIDQLVGAGTSIGANYCEADEAVSRKEFLNKIGTCKNEAKETKFFLRMAAKAVPAFQDDARRLWREAKELHLIFAKIFRSGRGSGG